ncbi:hypothetical protein CDAR_272571 [Caerostris darwini]|uniref:Uncharacterized protein n=1 Tax=Caerostris darwini TaxID=1538125 RepID=A0AAV4UZE3_9ARAC|nr:hypothetical protein CDAR_272571 [Caerostris darwini]
MGISRELISLEGYFNAENAINDVTMKAEIHVFGRMLNNCAIGTNILSQLNSSFANSNITVSKEEKELNVSSVKGISEAQRVKSNFQQLEERRNICTITELFSKLKKKIYKWVMTV